MDANTKRKINVNILGRQFNLEAASERHERFIRNSADTINRMSEKYSTVFQKGDEVETLIFVALNICIKNLDYKEELQRLQSEAETLEREFSGYLGNIDGNK